MPSFSVRCIFRWARRPDQAARNLYEERITLWKAADIDEALRLAEDEADAHASDGETYIGFAQAYALYEDIAAEGVEVFSLLRESDLEPDQYIGTFFATSNERTK
jgi:hypothetical protein